MWMTFNSYGIPYGLMVRIFGFHPDGPGSIPGMGIFLVSTGLNTHFQSVEGLINKKEFL